MSRQASTTVSLALALAAIAAAGGGSGCSAIASRNPGPAPCEFSPPDPDPCPAPSHCVAGFCTGACATPMAETCNGLDDDCNGMIDDDVMCAGGGLCIRGECRTDCSAGELCNGRDDDCDTMVDENLDVDNDSDGFVACNADPMQSDCNDRDADIHPGATEICNGFDDDCDPNTSDLMAHCAATGELCAVPTGETLPRCIDPRDCRLIPCLAGQLCDTTSRCCDMGQPTCGAPTDCRTTGCPGGQICVPMGTASMTYSCQSLTPLGGGCTNNGDCASGHCYPRPSLALASGASSGICGAACCSDADCSAYPDTVCWAPGTGARSCVPRSELAGVDLGFTLCTTRRGCGTRACVAYSLTTPTGSGGAWECASPSSGSCDIFGLVSCPSGVCDPYNLGQTCVSPCGSSQDCGSSSPACAYVGVHSQWLTGCVASGGNAQGESCGNDGDCRSGLCLGGTCADVCCNDSTCGAGASCSPLDHAGWEMRCIPNAGPP